MPTQKLSHINDIKKSLVDFVHEAHKTGIRGDGNWTHGIKQRLVHLAWQHNYQVSTSGFHGECESEWLYDMVWYREEGENENALMSQVALVVESEWGLHFNCIKYDFEKLLLANADLKLMICQASAENRDHRLEYFRSAIEAYRGGRKGDEYLIAILDWKDEEFHFEQMVKQ